MSNGNITFSNNGGQPAKANPVGAFFIILSMFLIFPLFWLIGKGNWFARTKIKIDESGSSIDVQLKRRHDTLIKLIDAVKGSMQFERQTLADVIDLRMGGTMADKAAASAKMDKVSGQIAMQFENYPNLKSSEAVVSLMEGVREIEDDLAASRRIYNSNVSVFNREMVSYPSNVIAKWRKETTKYFFEASEEERADVQISFA